jgi:hypothetical protein
VSANPLDEIEQRRGRMDIGQTGGDIFRGARGSGLSYLEALGVTAAWYLALFRNNGDEPEQAQDDRD